MTRLLADVMQVVDWLLISTCILTTAAVLAIVLGKFK